MIDAKAISAPTMADVIAARITMPGRSATLSVRVTRKPSAVAYTTAMAEPSVAVKAPPTMPPITSTGMASTMMRAAQLGQHGADAERLAGDGPAAPCRDPRAQADEAEA